MRCEVCGEKEYNWGYCDFAHNVDISVCLNCYDIYQLHSIHPKHTDPTTLQDVLKKAKNDFTTKNRDKYSVA